MPKHHLYVIGNNNATLINAARGATKLGDEFLLPVEGGVNTLARGDLLLLTVNSNEPELALPPVVFRTEARQDNARHRRFVVQRVLSTSLPLVNGLRNLIHEYQPAIVFLKRGELIELNDETAVALLTEMQGKLPETISDRHQLIKEYELAASKLGVLLRKLEPLERQGQSDYALEELLIEELKKTGLLITRLKEEKLDKWATQLTITFADVEKGLKLMQTRAQKSKTDTSKAVPSINGVEDTTPKVPINGLAVDESEVISERVTNQLEKVSEELTVLHVSESDFLAHVIQYIKARGYYFSEETIINYHISLKTRPFVILAGLSGTGKSKLTQLYAEALGCKNNEQYHREAVRPNWTDDTPVLGYYDAIRRDWMRQPPLGFVLHAVAHPEQLHFLCLDEMNLARVEYYFAQFLSALEEERHHDRILRLYDPVLGEVESLCAPPIVTLPRNLLFAGTINIDETIQHLSDKVIDRANTLEFYEIDFGKVPARTLPPMPFNLDPDNYYGFQATTPDESRRNDLTEIHTILSQMRMGIGYRVLHDIELYLANAKDLLPLDVAFDIQVRQRILPRVRGGNAIQKPLEALLTYCENKQLTRSASKLSEMKDQLDTYGNTAFFR